MDFIARAGSMLDKAHRLAGLLLLIIIVMAVVIIALLGNNAQLADRIDTLANRLQVYVVPGSQAGVYSPSYREMLIENFAEHVIQSLNTFTYETLERQYNEIKFFFAPQMLTFAEGHYAELIRNARVDQRSALFIPTEGSFEAEPARSSNGSTVAGRQMVTILGTSQQIIAGSVVEVLPMRMTLELQEVNVSRSNPFGYMLVSYREEVLD